MEDDDEGDFPSYPWSWFGTSVNVIDFASSLLYAGASLMDRVRYDLAAANNYAITRRQFQEAAVLELETITGGDVG